MRLIFRKMRAEDRDFVIGSWVHSFRRAMSAGLIAMEDWQRVMSPQIEKIVDRPRVRVLVVADANAGDAITDLFGHLVWEDIERQELPLVYYCYVKHAYRKSGLARGLMKHAGIDPLSAFPFVCHTHAVASLREAGKLPNARWRPLLGRYTNKEQVHEREAE